MAKVLADELGHAMRSVADAQDRLSSTYHRLSALAAGPNPLPAQPPTEEQIVAALKADPAMAGRAVVEFSMQISARDRENFRDSAMALAAHKSDSDATRLQSLAVALAAASYRG